MILDCGHEPSVHLEHTTGYGTDLEGKTFCYDCAALQEKAFMVKEGKTILYLTGSEITDWPGHLRFKAHVQKGNHNIAGVRYDAWFTDHTGARWHGVQYGNNTQIIHCKRLKV